MEPASELIPPEPALEPVAPPAVEPEPAAEPATMEEPGFVPDGSEIRGEFEDEARVPLATGPEPTAPSFAAGDPAPVAEPLPLAAEPASAPLTVAPAIIPSEDVEEPMAHTNATSGTLLLLRAVKDVDPETLKLLAQQLQSATLAPGDALVVVGSQELGNALGDAVPFVANDGKVQGAMVRDILAAHPGAKVLVTSSSEVIFAAGGLAAFASAAKSAPLAYSYHIEDRDGKKDEVKVHEHNGCPHERFEFGPVIAYNLDMVRALGGIRADLNYAWEYDIHLKLMEKAPFHRITDFTYTRFIPVVIDSKGSKVFSPGAGPLGGFSYVFYPADVEKEVTSVFEEALKRRGAWIDHPAVPVDHKGRTYPVLGSIVIPILNRVKYIGNAIAKVQGGTLQDFEIIIVDNGSTDGTIDAVKAIAAKDSRIKLLHGTGGSIASALNEGIRAARGKYICQLDSDDEYSPDCLEKMLGHLESHPNCGLAISYYRLMDEAGNIIHDIAPITHSGYSRNQILRRDGGGAVRIFPRVVLEEFGLYDQEHYGNFGEDYDMVLKVGEKYDVDRVHHVLYHYRRHSDNTDVTRDPAMKYHNKNRSRQEALKRRTALNKALGKA